MRSPRENQRLARVSPRARATSRDDFAPSTVAVSGNASSTNQSISQLSCRGHFYRPDKRNHDRSHARVLV